MGYLTAKLSYSKIIPQPQLSLKGKTPLITSAAKATLSGTTPQKCGVFLDFQSRRLHNDNTPYTIQTIGALTSQDYHGGSNPQKHVITQVQFYVQKCQINTQSS